MLRGVFSMSNNWRDAFLERAKADTTGSDEWVDVRVSPMGSVSVTLVSNRLKGLSGSERRARVTDWLTKAGAPSRTGFLSLYTVEEAKEIGLMPPAAAADPEPVTWHDLAHWVAEPTNRPSADGGVKKPGLPRTVAFYSYKGGVGRTTALIHVAYLLAQRGRKVVAVDLDLEAPGLTEALAVEPTPTKGIIDYFYERAYLPGGTEPSISITDIFGEVRVSDGRGRLFVVPAGKVSLEYLAKVDDLRANAITHTGRDLWTTFAKEIGEHLQPDIILVDSRTGINEWGAFSLLRAADEVVALLYPNEQNLSGALLLRDLVESLGKKVSFVFSPVPAADGVGYERVKAVWDRLNQPPLGESGEGESEPDDLSDMPEPLLIPYVPVIALADRYPVVGLLSYYAKIANLVDDDTTAARLADVLMGTDRWRILEDLRFPAVNATDPSHDLRHLFQRTGDFDRFLDQTTTLIRGRKGTGKSALYWLLLTHSNTAKDLARGRLDKVTCLSGHGSFRIRPTRDEFIEVDKILGAETGSWEAFWRAYLLLRVHFEQRGYMPRTKKFEPLRSLLGSVPKSERWQVEHTRALARMSTDSDLKLLAKDALYGIEDTLQRNEASLWLLYDDLDEDIPVANGLRQRVLTGLFQVVQDADARRLSRIRFKIFLREDIWSRLVFDNKSHLNGRDLLLQWTRVDFMRLALRQTLQSKLYRDLVDRFAPVGDIDQADEESIEDALQLLWGSRREPGRRSKYVSRWVYERLTDASGTAFPRSLNRLLTAARDHELQYRGQTVASPMDRLLRAQSLNQGLVAASAQRCAEMREEYPELIPFFDGLNEFPSVASEQEMERAWREYAAHVADSFSDFIDLLTSIGLVSRGADQFRFAHIFIHGFNMQRERRKF
ncbi:MAG: P-loop ATPase, Sll1717 family [Bacillota bacterium]